MEKILVAIRLTDVAPRFDLTAEVLIAEARDGAIHGEPRTIILPTLSADELCSLIIREGATTVVCGGIEESHYQYLSWKKIRVIDGVIGPAAEVLGLLLRGDLKPGAVVRVDDAGR